MLISASSDAEFGFLPCPFAHDTQQQEAQQPTPDLKHLHLLVLQPPLQPQQVRPGSAAARESAVRCVHAQGNSPTSLVRVFLPTAQPALPSTAQITKIRSPASNSRSRLLSPRRHFRRHPRRHFRRHPQRLHPTGALPSHRNHPVGKAKTQQWPRCARAQQRSQRQHRHRPAHPQHGDLPHINIEK